MTETLTGVATAATPDFDHDVPVRAAGVELLGELDGSGYKEPPCLARRADGQTIQLTTLLYRVLEAIDGLRDLASIARHVSDRVGKEASADDIRFLVEEKLRPLGLLRRPDGSEPEVHKAAPRSACGGGSSSPASGRHGASRRPSPGCSPRPSWSPSWSPSGRSSDGCSSPKASPTPPTDLGVAGWVKEPTVVDRPDGSRLVTGSVDVADLLSDLSRISAQTGGGGAGDTLDSGSARRLQRLVRNSEFTAELDRTGLPRTLRAVVDFGRDLPAELRAALGSYASPRLEVTLAVDPAAH